MKNYTREDTQKHIRENGAPDYMLVHGVLYTMDNYDEKGAEITYLNKSHMLEMRVLTSNRYGEIGFTDADVILDDAYGYRRDIQYLDEFTTPKL